jgi:hypothetical protein
MTSFVHIEENVSVAMGFCYSHFSSASALPLILSLDGGLRITVFSVLLNHSFPTIILLINYPSRPA